GQQGRSGRLAYPDTEALLTVVCEQGGGDDVRPETVVHRHVRAATVRRHAQQHTLMLQGAHEALVPGAPVIAESTAQLGQVHGACARFPQKLRNGCQRGANILRVVPLCSRSEVRDAVANLIKIAVEQRGQGAGHSIDANHFLTGGVRHLAEQPEGQWVAKEVRQRGIGWVNLPVPEVEPDRINRVYTVVGDLHARRAVGKSFVLKFWPDGAD